MSEDPVTPEEQDLDRIYSALAWAPDRHLIPAEDDLDALVADLDALAARLAEAERQRDEALASVVLYVNERDAARDGWEAQVRSEEREMRRRIEAEARADNLAPYVQRSQQFEARVAALTEALRSHFQLDDKGRPAKWMYHDDFERIVAAADRPEGTTPTDEQLLDVAHLGGWGKRVRKITVCDVCDQEIRDNARRTVRYRWFDWGFTHTQERIEDVCPSCWSEMSAYALAKRREATTPQEGNA